MDFNQEAVIAQTCTILAEVFGFSFERAREAVNAIADKSDVELAWDWLLDHGEDDSGGPVVPTQICYHVQELADLPINCVEHAVTFNLCVEGCIGEQNWLCLVCGTSRCSRYSSGHNIEHFHNTGHAVALSLCDLSVWCYLCNKYIKSSKLDRLLSDAAYFKHHDTVVPSVKDDSALVNRVGICIDLKGTQRHRPLPGNIPAALENPDRTQRAIDLLSERNILYRLVAVRSLPPSNELLLSVHSDRYLSILRATESGTSEAYNSFLAICGTLHREWAGLHSVDSLDADIYVGPHSYAAAISCAGAAIGACEAICTGFVSSGFAFTRPPGHHACRDHTGGFCLLNNAALAARHALSSKAISVTRVLIVDWDIHHGNGIQDIFYEDPSVLYISVHSQEPQPGLFFHDDGLQANCGSGAGLGFNVNVPLGFCAKGYTDEDYMYIFDKIVLPIANQYCPDLIIVAAGFDSCEGDPTGRNRVTPSWFGNATKSLQDITSSAGRVLLLLEGGYNYMQTAACIESCLLSLLKWQPARQIRAPSLHEKVSAEVVLAVQTALDEQSEYWSLK